jgi:hypothetical protein
VEEALAIGPSSSARERTVDITTIGARSGHSRRIETWFYPWNGRVYLSGPPGPRDWAANLMANPRFTVHLKHGVVADLAATARPIRDEAERRRVLGGIIDGLNHWGGTARVQPERVEGWVVGSPLFEITFDDLPPS